MAEKDEAPSDDDDAAKPQETGGSGDPTPPDNPPAKDAGASGGAGVPPGESGSATTAPADREADKTDASEPTDGGSSKAVTLGAVLLVLIVGGVLVSFAISKGGDDASHGKPAGAR